MRPLGAALLVMALLTAGCAGNGRQESIPAQSAPAGQGVTIEGVVQTASKDSIPYADLKLYRADHQYYPGKSDGVGHFNLYILPEKYCQILVVKDGFQPTRFNLDCSADVDVILQIPNATQTDRTASAQPASPSPQPSGTSRPAGTTTGSSPAPPPPVPSSPRTDDRPPLEDPKVLTPVLMPTFSAYEGSGEGEPNIQVAPDGTIYVAPIIPLFVSTNGGKNFVKAGQSPTGTGDMSLAVDGYGTVYSAGLNADLTDCTKGSIPVQRSVDHGTTFTAPFDVSSGTGKDRQWIDATRDGVVVVTFRDCNAKLSSRTSFDGGQTWEKIVNIRGDVAAGPVTHDPTLPGRFYIAYASGNSAAISISDDYGIHWRERVITPSLPELAHVAFAMSIFPVVTVDDSGTVYAVWSTANPIGGVNGLKELSRQAVYLSFSLDGGDHWTAPRVISDPAKDARMAWGVAGAPGRLAVTWYESEVGVPAADVLPDVWDVRLWESVTADQPQPIAKAAALAVQQHIGSICVSGTVFCLAGDRSLLDFFQVTLNTAGQPVAAWCSNKVGGPLSLVPVATPEVYYGGLAAGTPLR